MNSSASTKACAAGLTKKTLLLASMYLCQAIPMGYVFGSLPVIMREQHMNLKSIGILFVLHLPWAFKFLVASRVDRWHIPALGRRRTWIFPLQWVGACLLLCASHTPPDTHFQAMFWVLLALNCVMAVNDIAVDGYAVDMLAPHERPWGNTIQAGARYAGMMLGGGLMLFLHKSMGWDVLCLVLAAIVVALSLPVLLHREMAPVSPPMASGTERAGVMAFLRRREVLWLLPVLIAPTAFAFSSFQLRTPLLVDLGFDARSLGGILMRYGYPAGLAGTVVAGWLLHRLGVRVFLRAFSALAVSAAAFAALRAQAGTIAPWMAAVLVCLDNILMGGITVWGYTLMMRASAGEYSGTGFAVLSSLFILVPLALSPAVGSLGDKVGFATLYWVLGGLALAGFVVAEAALRLGSSGIATGTAMGGTDRRQMMET